MVNSTKTMLNEAGIDMVGALKRFSGNEQLLAKYLVAFPNDPSYARLEEAMSDCNMDSALAAAYDLKCVCGNLGMSELYQNVCVLITAIEAQLVDDSHDMYYRVMLAREKLLPVIAQINN